jgi:hypothetical protein
MRAKGETTWSAVFSSRDLTSSDELRTHEASLARLCLPSGSCVNIYERTVATAGKIQPEHFTFAGFFDRLKARIKLFFGRPLPIELATPSACVGVKG